MNVATPLVRVAVRGVPESTVRRTVPAGVPVAAETVKVITALEP